MFTIGNMSENTFCLYGFNTLHSTEKRNPIFHVFHCLTYFTYHNDLTETEEIKKRGQEYIEELYKNFFFFFKQKKALYFYYTKYYPTTRCYTAYYESFFLYFLFLNFT